MMLMIVTEQGMHTTQYRLWLQRTFINDADDCHCHRLLLCQSNTTPSIYSQTHTERIKTTVIIIYVRYTQIMCCIQNMVVELRLSNVDNSEACWQFPFASLSCTFLSH